MGIGDPSEAAKGGRARSDRALPSSVGDGPCARLGSALGDSERNVVGILLARMVVLGGTVSCADIDQPPVGFLGDSLTEGPAVDRESAYPRSYWDASSPNAANRSAG